MIEKCSKKRIVFLLFSLISITLIIVYIESSWDLSPKQKFINENNSTCFERETFTVLKECHPCSKFEIASKSESVCIRTRNKEVLKCTSGEIVTRSCDRVAWLDTRNFYLFEATFFVVGLFSSIIAFVRQRLLDRKFFLSS